jgi:hypothetical protein
MRGRKRAESEEPDPEDPGEEPFEHSEDDPGEESADEESASGSPEPPIVSRKRRSSNSSGPSQKRRQVARPRSKRRIVVALSDDSDSESASAEPRLPEVCEVSPDEGEAHELVPTPNIATPSAVVRDVSHWFDLTPSRKNLGIRKCSVVLKNTASQEKRLKQLLMVVARKSPRTPLPAIQEGKFRRFIQRIDHAQCLLQYFSIPWML